MSIHLGARKGDIADTVLLAGDPLRAKYVAENFLSKHRCYNEVRSMYGYTGYYGNQRVSIQGSGMGMPSLAIYAHELIREYGVKKLIRIGTCGSLHKYIGLEEIILGTAASGDSHVNRLNFQGADYAPSANFELLLQAYNKAQELGLKTIQGPIFSTDSFYHEDPEDWKLWAKYGVLAVEMESQMLYSIAARYSVKALTILTVSDNLVTGESSSAKDREQSFEGMMKLALEIA